MSETWYYTSGIAAYRPSARGSVVVAVNAALEGLVRALAAADRKEATLKAMAEICECFVEHSAIDASDLRCHEGHRANFG
ncbi:hypothetical protein RvVAR0630_pl07000 (plasmid) [Agrobacterium vitis]|nr:hypothetical protein RvVAR0630_pl07000 [Agrobacterium vitis]